MSKRETHTDIVRLGPYEYIHVADQNSNVTRLEEGPQVFVRKDHEKIVTEKRKYIIIPPRHYCVIENPVLRDESKNVLKDKFGQYKLNHADREVRLTQDPFPLYPGEQLIDSVTKLSVVRKDEAYRLVALEDFEDESNISRRAGDEWFLEGPCTYYPRKECDFLCKVKATIINQGNALRVKALRDMSDKAGTARVAGEEWIVRDVGTYMPGPYEEIVQHLKATILTDKKAVHCRASDNFKDFLGKDRKTGEEWLVTNLDTQAIIPSVSSEIIQVVNITTLNSREYCVILNYVDQSGQNQLGKKILRRGECSFFLHPGEIIDEGVKTVQVLSENMGLVLEANEDFDDNGTARKAGDRWMIKGPCDYVPPVEVTQIEYHPMIPLDQNEGIYVRNTKTGLIRAIIGETYMLNEHEELWEKEFKPEIQAHLDSGRDPRADRNVYSAGDHVDRLRHDMHKRMSAPAGRMSRDESNNLKRPAYIPTITVTKKSRCTTLDIPHNSACQLYDYKNKSARVVFGPELVILQPDEQFTMLSLSAGKPKEANKIKCFVLLLGPDFCTDIIQVETVDHARLSLSVSYNWMFDQVTAQSSQEKARLLFSVPDFVGDMCKTLASRIRGAVAGVTFDEFHKNSARIIRGSVLGYDRTTNKILKRLDFPENLLSVTSVDIMAVEPVDQKTKDSLMKSVQLAIEITTNAQEATAKHEAQRIEQEAKGKLERQRIDDEALAEKAKQELLKLQTTSAALESTGAAKAEALARAEAAKIEGEANVEQARLRAQAAELESEAELRRLNAARDAEIEFLKKQNDLEIEKQKESTLIEVNKFKQMVDALGAPTIEAMASAGNNHQVKMLQSLGLTSTLITDGRNPINLLQTASGFVPSAQPVVTEEDN
jgi:major vault protein